MAKHLPSSNPGYATVDDLHLLALHYVYVPRINRALGQFKLSWNSHGVHTERGKTPNQLFTEGALRLCNSGQIAVDSASELYGVDFEDDSISPDDDPEDAGVVIPTIQVNILSVLKARLYLSSARPTNGRLSLLVAVN